MRLAPVIFVILLIVISVAGLGFFGGFNYILNFQNKINSNPSTLGSNGPITKPPASFVLNLDNPTDNLLVSKSDLVISGNTSPNLSILISSSTDDQVIVSKDDGTFSTDLTLDKGLNDIKIVAFDGTGQQRSQERFIYYTEDKI